MKIKYETLFDSPIFIIFINNIVNCIFIKFEFDSFNFWKQVSKSKLVINQHNIKTKVDLTFDLEKYNKLLYYYYQKKSRN